MSSHPKEEIIELKALRDFKRKIRAEIFKSVTSGNYANRDRILGKIRYAEYIEKENKTTYLSRVKNTYKMLLKKLSISLNLFKLTMKTVCLVI